MNPEIQDVLRDQNRKRRTRFWIGFFVLVMLGLAWAGLSKDPLEQDLFLALLWCPKSRRLPPLAQTAVHRSPRTTLAAVLAAILAAAVALIGFAPAPVAAQDDEFATVEIEVLSSVPWQEGQRVNASVTVRTERAVSGKLTVTNNPDGAAKTTYEFDVDVAADTVGVFPLALSTGWNGIEARAELESGGDAIAQDEIQRRPNGEAQTTILATLGIDDPPRRVDEIGGDTQLSLFEITGRLRGLESASSLVATTVAVRDLQGDPDRFATLQSWIQGGGQLIVDGPTASLDSDFHRFPTANPNRFGYGAGSIVYAQDWRDGVPLGGYQGSTGLRNLVEAQGLGSGSSGELGLLAGISLPRVSVIAGILLLYTVLAGPLLFGFVSTKRIQRKIWVMLPALSLVFVVGIVGFGFFNRSGSKDVHITIVEVHDSGSRATSNLLLTSSIGGNRTIEVPDTWNYLGQARTEGQRPTVLRVGSSKTDISFEVPPGSNTTARVSGAASEYDGVLTIANVRLDGDNLTADITNDGLSDLEEALLLFGNTRAEIGRIGAGETVSASVEAFDFSTRTMPELLLWPRVEQAWMNSGNVAVPVNRDALTAAGSWTEWRVEKGLSVLSEGVLGVVGWTDDLPAPIGGVETGRTALFARANIDPAVLSPIGYSTSVRLPARESEPVFQGNFAGYPQDFRIALAPGTDPERLAIRLTRESAGLAFFVDGEWQFASLDGAGEKTISIPVAAVDNGEVRFRSYEADWGWGVGLTAAVVANDETAESAALSSTPSFRNPDGGGGFGFEEVEAMEFEEAFGEGELWSSNTLGAVGSEPLVSSGELPGFGFDQYFFTIEEGQEVTIRLESEDGDTFLQIFDLDGFPLFEDDDSGTFTNSELVFIPPQGGEYELRSISRGEQLFYQLTIEVNE